MMLKKTLLALALLSLAGCDAVEQSTRDLASKAEQAAQELAQEKLKESVNALNRQVDKVQEKAETWISQPPAEKEADEKPSPEAEDSIPATLET